MWLSAIFQIISHDEKVSKGWGRQELELDERKNCIQKENVCSVKRCSLLAKSFSKTRKWSQSLPLPHSSVEISPLNTYYARCVCAYMGLSHYSSLSRGETAFSCVGCSFLIWDLNLISLTSWGNPLTRKRDKSASFQQLVICLFERLPKQSLFKVLCSAWKAREFHNVQHFRALKIAGYISQSHMWTVSVIYKKPSQILCRRWQRNVKYIVLNWAEWVDSICIIIIIFVVFRSDDEGLPSHLVNKRIEDR